MNAAIKTTHQSKQHFGRMTIYRQNDERRSLTIFFSLHFFLIEFLMKVNSFVIFSREFTKNSMEKIKELKIVTFEFSTGKSDNRPNDEVPMFTVTNFSRSFE